MLMRQRFAPCAARHRKCSRPTTPSHARGAADAHPRRSFALAAGDNVIGRDPRSAVWLDDESVSRRHALISVDEQTARVKDLESTNGTFLNRAALDSPTVLQDGDIVRVGSLKLTFRTMSDSAARTKRLRRGSATGGSKA